jgi:hypothetical protein
MTAADTTVAARSPGKLSHDLFHGLSPDEFGNEAQALANAGAMTPEVRGRLKAQLVERLMTPVDRPSWGPDWIRRGERDAPRRGQANRASLLAGLLTRTPAPEREEEPTEHDLSRGEREDAAVIVRNLEKSRQVHHYSGLYALAAVIAVAIAFAAMSVDYQIIRGDIWTRALSNEFMVVPASLKSTVVFKSLQVIFAVLIVHVMLKITGAYGRNALVTTAFLFSLVMIGCLGYLVAYNNMTGGTSATLEHADGTGTVESHGSSIDQLFASLGDQHQAQPVAPVAQQAGMLEEFSLPLPKLSQRSLANADSWIWLAFASVIFFIVTVVAALYLQTMENNVRNVVISRDYRHRQRQFAQLHLLELADRRQAGTP